MRAAVVDCEIDGTLRLILTRCRRLTAATAWCSRSGQHIGESTVAHVAMDIEEGLVRGQEGHRYRRERYRFRLATRRLGRIINVDRRGRSTRPGPVQDDAAAVRFHQPAPALYRPVD